MSQLYLAHHGILGQKWGVRRYQNPDGSLTSTGKKRVKETQKRLLKKGAFTSTVVSDENGNLIGVDAKVLRRKGKKAAIEDSNNPENIKKWHKIEGKEFDNLYDTLLNRHSKTAYNSIDKETLELASKIYQSSTGHTKKSLNEILKDNSERYNGVPPSKKDAIKKNAIKIGAATAGTAALAYGGYQAYKHLTPDTIKVPVTKTVQQGQRMVGTYKMNGQTWPRFMPNLVNVTVMEERPNPNKLNTSNPIAFYQDAGKMFIKKVTKK